MAAKKMSLAFGVGSGMTEFLMTGSNSNVLEGGGRQALEDALPIHPDYLSPPAAGRSSVPI
jgi:hypothetical protein